MRWMVFSRVARAACATLPGLLMNQAVWAQALSAPLAATPAGAASANANHAALTPLTLDAALDLALAYHPDLRAALSERDAAQAVVKQAASWPNPELSALLEDTRAQTRSSTLQLNQPIELGGKRAARVRAAELAQQQAELGVAARRAQVRAQALTAFYDLAVVQERVRLADEMGQLSARALDAASKRVAAGKVSPVEEVKAKVAQAQTRASAAGAASQLRAARQQLAAALGDTVIRFDRVQADINRLPNLPAWAEIDARLAASPALAPGRQEISRREALIEIERAAQVPDLKLSVGVKRDAQLGINQAIFGVSLVLPVFDRNQGKLLEASRREDKARAEWDALLAAQRADSSVAFEQLSAALAEAVALRDDVLPGATQALDAATKGYELGKFGFLEVLDAQRTLFEGKTQALQAAAQAWRAHARLSALLADPSTSASSTPAVPINPAMVGAPSATNPR